MKIIAIGDIHGRSIWKNIVSANSYDKVVFLGDYFDAFDIHTLDQIDNFKDIMEFKKSFPDKVICLIGNHDYHYMRGVSQHYTGFNSTRKMAVDSVLHQALKSSLLQVCFVSGKYLFVHAGVTKTWCDDNDIDMENIEQSINDTFKYKPDVFKFTSGENRNEYGDDVCQSPIWVRPPSLRRDMIPGYTQVVGHTNQDEVVIAGSIILVDALESGEFLQITDGSPSVAR